MSFCRVAHAVYFTAFWTGMFHDNARWFFVSGDPTEALNYWWTLAVKAWSKVGDHVRSEQLVGCSVGVMPPSTVASPPHPMRLDANVWIAENDITNF